MNRVLTLEFVRVTEAAAVKAGRLMGKGDKNGADQLAVDGMHSILSTVPIDGTVVIGEGEMDEAPMLYIGEKVGAGGTEVDIAVDPLEGTNLTAKGRTVPFPSWPSQEGRFAPCTGHVHGKTLCWTAGQRPYRLDPVYPGKPAPHRRRLRTRHR